MRTAVEFSPDIAAADCYFIWQLPVTLADRPHKRCEVEAGKGQVIVVKYNKVRACNTQLLRIKSSVQLIVLGLQQNYFTRK